MQQKKSEGIILKTQEYKESERILSAFTFEEGLIKLIVKGISRTKPTLLAATTPLTIVEICYLKGRSDLFTLQDAAIKENLLFLRSSLPRLSAAAEIAKAILLSQLPEKASPPLYTLIKAYLLKLPAFQNTESLLASFYLKLLIHEGALSPRHPPNIFTTEEWEALLPLAAATQFETLKCATLPLDLLTKVRQVFLSSLD